MRRHRRGRITVQSQPTGAARGMTRLMGVIHAVFGFVFVVISLTEIMPVSGLFGLPFLLIGGFFCINGIRIAVSKNGLAHRVGYDVETGIEEETIVGLLEDVDREAESRPQESHDHIPSTALDAKGRLEQLESLKSAGLITHEEYQKKREEILQGL